MAGCGCFISHRTHLTAIPMNWCGSTSRPTLSAAWRSPTSRISKPKSVHPCVNYKMIRRRSDLFTKSHPSNTPHDSAITYGLINKRPDVLAFMRSYEAEGKLETRDRVRSIG